MTGGNVSLEYVYLDIRYRTHRACPLALLPREQINIFGYVCRRLKRLVIKGNHKNTRYRLVIHWRLVPGRHAYDPIIEETLATTSHRITSSFTNQA